MDFEKWISTNFIFGLFSNLIFTACKIQVRNWPKMEFVEIHFSKSIFQKSSTSIKFKYENPQTILIRILCPFATQTKVKNIFKNLVIWINLII